MVFLDANILWGSLTTDVVLSLAAHKLITPTWSETVLNEVRRTTADRVPPDVIHKRLSAMQDFFPEAFVGGFGHLIGSMPAHEGDQHVLAAATHRQADFLITENQKHFWPERGDLDVTVLTLNDLGRGLLTRDPPDVLEAISPMTARHRKPPRTLTEFVERGIAINELRGFAWALNEHLPPRERVHNPSRHLPPLSPAAQALAGWRRGLATGTSTSRPQVWRHGGPGHAAGPRTEL